MTQSKELAGGKEASVVDGAAMISDLDEGVVFVRLGRVVDVDEAVCVDFGVSIAFSWNGQEM